MDETKSETMVSDVMDLADTMRERKRPCTWRQGDLSFRIPWTQESHRRYQGTCFIVPCIVSTAHHL